ncbi:MAG TPA: fumarylacetoacetate hydrolase family protein [Sphingomonas sp.]|nr:fumarylacetoacetate hydrolase family protein [Sphingomonas sp.]
MILGTAYGVVLNDGDERGALDAAFSRPPYNAPPIAPVVYIKPRNCFRFGDAAVAIPAEVGEVALGSTIALLFGRDCQAGDAPLPTIAGACLALDLSAAETDYYRPAISQRCRDGFLPLGQMTPFEPEAGPIIIETAIDGRVAHRWSTARLVRPIERLIADLASFMTLCAGDLLLVGLPGDAVRGRAGATIDVSATGDFPRLRTRLVAEA